MSSTSAVGAFAYASTADEGDLQKHDLFLSDGSDNSDCLDSIPVHKDPKDATRYIPTEPLSSLDARIPKATRDRLSAALEQRGVDEASLKDWTLSYVPSTYNRLRLGTKETEWPLYFSNGPLGSNGKSGSTPDGDTMDLD